MDRCSIVQLAGLNDYRVQGTAEGGRWNTPLDTSAQEELDAVFMAESGGKEVCSSAMHARARVLSTVAYNPTRLAIW